MKGHSCRGSTNTSFPHERHLSKVVPGREDTPRRLIHSQQVLQWSPLLFNKSALPFARKELALKRRGLRQFPFVLKVSSGTLCMSAGVFRAPKSPHLPTPLSVILSKQIKDPSLPFTICGFFTQADPKPAKGVSHSPQPSLPPILHYPNSNLEPIFYTPNFWTWSRLSVGLHMAIYSIFPQSYTGFTLKPGVNSCRIPRVPSGSRGHIIQVVFAHLLKSTYI